ncbi:hypothetical protein [Nocardia sp. NPDC002869]|uniref:hypothetical protein n=1 Tax=Nocardia sp. NPDC002869 TaxID=3161032 RepID=UPI00398C91B6
MTGGAEESAGDRGKQSLAECLTGECLAGQRQRDADTRDTAGESGSTTDQSRTADLYGHAPGGTADAAGQGRGRWNDIAAPRRLTYHRADQVTDATRKRRDARRLQVERFAVTVVDLLQLRRSVDAATLKHTEKRRIAGQYQGAAFCRIRPALHGNVL